MITTSKFKLLPSAEQRKLLGDTMRVFNKACTYADQTACAHGVFKRFGIHEIAYGELRKEFPLCAQMACKVFAKVADAHKVGKRTKPRRFRAMGSVLYDQRILTVRDNGSVSIWCLGGRQKMTLHIPEALASRFALRKSEAKLMFEDGNYYLSISVEEPEAVPIEPQGTIGVDMGIVNIATTSDGQSWTGDSIEKCRTRHARLRRALQKKHTKSAKRHLVKIRKRETRFRKDVNHCISKQIVKKAEDTKSAIALEDLKGIRERTTVRHEQKSRHAGWAFAQLRSYIEYKAQRVGVSVILVDPRNTSRTCPHCGHVDPLNRPNRDSFRCRRCAFSGAADHVAAINIAAKAPVSAPIVGGSSPSGCSFSHKPPALAVG